MKKLFLCALVALVAFIMPSAASAQTVKPTMYECKELGVSFLAPSNVNLKLDEGNCLMAMSADEMFVLSLVPFDLNKCSDEDLANLWARMAEAARLDLERSTDEKISTETIWGSYKIGYRTSGKGRTSVGFAKKIGTDSSFLVTILAFTDEYDQYIESTLKNFNALKSKKKKK